ncbi:MAG TPA: molybdenum cofactor guanylyltransferase [Bryobacteraceae bacterium]|nr:molybdenum cofactor guanylyltransferase [Bryobacteraceae bacterium]
MVAAGFVLAGGESRRMGRDKALLLYRGRPLIAHVAGTVEKGLGSQAWCGSGPVAIVGHPDRYADLGYRVLADIHANCGPLGGIVTALNASAAAWNLVVACDMPNLTVTNLGSLLDRAAASQGRCVAARGPSGEAEPLCAIYHRDCLAVLTRALRVKRFKMKEILPELEPDLVDLPAESLANLNTPEEWMALEEQPG